MTRDQLARAIFDICHLTGEFKLRSGQVSKEYFDKYRFEAQPKILKAIAQQLVPLIPQGTQALAGLEVGGIPIATALSLETGLPVVFVRKKAKDYGTCQFAEGLDVKGLNLCVIEDVVTTGGQVLLSTDDLRGLGAKVENVLCVIQRDESAGAKLTDKNLKLRALFTQGELKNSKG